MLLSCCGVFFNTKGFTFERISRYKTEKKNLIKAYSNGHKTSSEKLFIAVCDNCGHYIIKLFRYFEDINKIEKEEYRGIEADNFFYSVYDKLIETPIISPFEDIKHKKTIPFIYGKCLDSLTQIPRYIDESDNAGSLIENPIRVYEQKKSAKP